MRSEGSTFWVKFELIQPYEESSLKHAGELINEAICSGIAYSEAILKMNTK